MNCRRRSRLGSHISNTPPSTLITTGNGRTARLLTTLILHLGTYDLKGLYALEEYYARNLKLIMKR
jgi:hypothetical protein